MRAERQREAQEFRAQGTAEKNRIQATADREVTVIKAEANRKSEQIRGEGDGERNRIFAEAFTQDPEFFGFYRSMQSYEQSMRQGDTRFVISPDSDKFREYFKYFSDPTAQGGSPSSGQQPRR
jgi:membrane protease subunit HflC